MPNGSPTTGTATDSTTTVAHADSKHMPKDIEATATLGNPERRQALLTSIQAKLALVNDSNRQGKVTNAETTSFLKATNIKSFIGPELLEKEKITLDDWKAGVEIIFLVPVDKAFLVSLQNYLASFLETNENATLALTSERIGTALYFKLKSKNRTTSDQSVNRQTIHKDGNIVVTIKNDAVNISRALIYHAPLIDKYKAAIYFHSIAQLELIYNIVTYPNTFIVLSNEIKKVIALISDMSDSDFPHGKRKFREQLELLDDILFDIDQFIYNSLYNHLIINRLAFYYHLTCKIEKTYLKLNFLPSTLDLSSSTNKINPSLLDLYSSTNKINLFYLILLSHHVNTLIFKECIITTIFLEDFFKEFPRKLKNPIKLMFDNINISRDNLIQLLAFISQTIPSAQITVTLREHSVSIICENSKENITSKLVIHSRSKQSKINLNNLFVIGSLFKSTETSDAETTIFIAIPSDEAKLIANHKPNVRPVSIVSPSTPTWYLEIEYNFKIINLNKKNTTLSNMLLPDLLTQHFNATKQAVVNMFVELQQEQLLSTTEDHADIQAEYWIAEIDRQITAVMNSYQRFPAQGVEQWIGANASFIKNCVDPHDKHYMTAIFSAGGMKTYLTCLLKFFDTNHPGHSLIPKIKKIQSNWNLGIQEINNNVTIKEMEDDKEDAKQADITPVLVIPKKNYKATELILLVLTEDTDTILATIDEWKKKQPLDLSLQDAQGNTALIAAAKLRKEKVSLHLLKYIQLHFPSKLVSILNKVDNNGKSAIGYAYDLGQINVLLACKNAREFFAANTSIAIREQQICVHFINLSINPYRDENATQNYLQRPDGSYIGDEKDEFIPATQQDAKKHVALITNKLKKCTDKTLQHKLEVEQQVVNNLMASFSGKPLIVACMEGQTHFIQHLQINLKIIIDEKQKIAASLDIDIDIAQKWITNNAIPFLKNYLNLLEGCPQTPLICHLRTAYFEQILQLTQLSLKLLTPTKTTHVPYQQYLYKEPIVESFEYLCYYLANKSTTKDIPYFFDAILDIYSGIRNLDPAYSQHIFNALQILVTARLDIFKHYCNQLMNRNIFTPWQLWCIAKSSLKKNPNSDDYYQIYLNAAIFVLLLSDDNYAHNADVLNQLSKIPVQDKYYTKAKEIAVHAKFKIDMVYFKIDIHRYYERLIEITASKLNQPKLTIEAVANGVEDKRFDPIMADLLKTAKQAYDKTDLKTLRGAVNTYITQRSNKFWLLRAYSSSQCKQIGRRYLYKLQAELQQYQPPPILATQLKPLDCKMDAKTATVVSNTKAATPASAAVAKYPPLSTASTTTVVPVSANGLSGVVNAAMPVTTDQKLDCKSKLVTK